MQCSDMAAQDQAQSLLEEVQELLLENKLLVKEKEEKEVRSGLPFPNSSYTDGHRGKP